MVAVVVEVVTGHASSIDCTTISASLASVWILFPSITGHKYKLFRAHARYDVYLFKACVFEITDRPTNTRARAHTQIYIIKNNKFYYYNIIYTYNVGWAYDSC